MIFRGVWMAATVVLWRARLPLTVFAVEFLVAVAEAIEHRRTA